MSFRSIVYLVIPAFIFLSCSTSRKATTEVAPPPAAVEEVIPEPKNYQGSVTMLHQLIHTKLNVSFDWTKSEMPATAEITLKPHFYTTNQLYLDARGMKINEVKIIKGGNKEELAYEYRNDSLCITLDKPYSRRDTFIVYIDYIAQPEGLPKGGSSAISNDKGLYFINADGSDPNKPQQVWTQGETQASSVWFPTIDRPNQKTTQELYITIDTAFVTLSNGKLVSSIINKTAGTRTDYWRQTLPHAPYLFMMAIGKYAVVKDTWRGIDVTYYVEPEYEKYARGIFAHTPEMIEFFSKTMGVNYAWEKYAQVVVRDYVSGAMENTSATIFGEFVQKDERALLDANNDDIVSHELFHHWFGDLVTCESWSNLPLNESFATYGEYLWNEYKYGSDEADYTLHNDLKSYLQEARNKQVNLIRFDYEQQEDMFDRHSYQKGGRVLHMLRKYTGDEAFFESLKKYLNDNRLGAAEIHHLRLAFEAVTGEDMNWFFNQWFLDKGHPSLKIDYDYNAEKGIQYVKVQQVQNFETTPLYKLPVEIDLYTSKGIEKKKVTITKQEETFEFAVSEKPALVNFDAQKMLICSKTDNHTPAEWVTLYQLAPKYLDRYEALSIIAKDYRPGTPEAEVMAKALNDPHWNLRSLAIKNCENLIRSDSTGIKQQLIQIAKTDKKSSVKVDAMNILSDKYSADPEVSQLMSDAADNISYRVMEAALTYLAENNPAEGMQKMKNLETENNKNIRSVLSGIYVKHGSDREFGFMTDALNSSSGFSKYGALLNYGKFLLKCAPENVMKGMETIADIGFNHPQWFIRLSATQALAEIAKSYGVDRPAGTNGGDAIIVSTDNIKKKADELVQQIKAKETDPQLLKIYQR